MNILHSIEGKLLKTLPHPDYRVRVAETNTQVKCNGVSVYNRPFSSYEGLLVNAAPREQWRKVSDDGSIQRVSEIKVLEYIIPTLSKAKVIGDIGAGGCDAASGATDLPKRPLVVAIDAGINTVFTVTPEPSAAPRLILRHDDWNNLPTDAFPDVGFLFAINSVGMYGKNETAVPSISGIAKPGCVLVGTEICQSQNNGILFSQELAKQGWETYQAGTPNEGYFVGVKR